MNIDSLTIAQVKEIAEIAKSMGFGTCGAESPVTNCNGMIGKYVIVRCRDAGVHAGVLQCHSGRECVLAESRRLWYWKPANNASFLSGVANEGLHPDSRVGSPIRVHLTENCEIIQCSEKAKESIIGVKNHEPK